MKLRARLAALEAKRGPGTCLECAIRRLNRDLGEPEPSEKCRHLGLHLHHYISELDAAEAKELTHANA
jgi:hypothetical protein